MLTIDHIALETVHSIEDELVKAHSCRAQRNARLQTIIINAIRTALSVASNGIVNYAPVPSSGLPPANHDC